MKRRLWLMLLMAAATVHSMTAETSNHLDDTLLRALKIELERSREQLKLGNMPVPYYMEYSVADMDQFVAEAEFGALRIRQRTRGRFLRAVVRVGDYRQDSYFGQGQGIVEMMPCEPDLLALRHQIWLATDRAYKQAIEALTQKQALLKQYQVQDPVDDFTPEPAVQSLASLTTLVVDESRWTKALEEVTGLYRDYPSVQSFEATARFTAVNRYLVNTEGATVRKGSAGYLLLVQGSTQASDGMRLERSDGFAETSVDQLPSEEQFTATAIKLLTTLTELQRAAIVEDEYRGPVIFDADAAGDLLEYLLAPNLIGNRPNPGVPARTTGQFATSYKSRVLPDFLSLVDDPTTSSLENRTLAGTYFVDDEGVKAVPVKLVDKGTLVNYLMGREPIRDFPVSNGHGRSVGVAPPKPAIGNLILRSSNPIPKAELKKRLLEMCKARSLQYGYHALTTDPTLNPRLLYRVWVKDGREELVRGAVFAELDTRTLRNDIVAAGDDLLVHNRVHELPSAVVSPSLLFDELEVRRADRKNDKLPLYPPPLLPGGK